MFLNNEINDGVFLNNYLLLFCLGTVLVPAPTQRLQELSQTSTTADQWEITGKGKDSLNALPIQAGKQVTADAEKLSDTFDQTKRKSYPHDPLENSVFDQVN